MKAAVVLVSGGLDSATVLALAIHDGYAACALSFDYGQRHRVELESARRLTKTLGVREHRIAQIDLRVFGGSALTDNIPVPKGLMAEEIPITYVPARNTIFLSYALAWAEVLHSADIFIGANAIDYSGYPDCRPEFIEQFQKLANVATKAGVEGANFRVHAPLLRLTKGEIIRKGATLGVDFAMTHSCYDPAPAGFACGECNSCRLRQQGFRDAGLRDPISYANA